MTILPHPEVVATGYERKGPLRFQTSKLWLPRLPNTVNYMHEIAKELSFITGRNIEFKDHRDNCSSVYGSFGSFIVS